MPRGGRYRSVRVALWSDEAFQALSAWARLTLLALSTGSHSNLAGISLLSLEALQRDTGLDATELAAALAELEKHPRPSHSFIVRDTSPVVWVRRFLRDDPSRESDPDVRNPKHRMAVETILGALPRSSPTVKKFRNYYHFPAHRVFDTPSDIPADTPSDTPSHTLCASRIRRTDTEITDTETGEGELERERGDGSPLGPLSVAIAGKDNDKDNSEAETITAHAQAIGRRLGFVPTE